jgi:hypothetical protein
VVQVEVLSYFGLLVATRHIFNHQRGPGLFGILYLLNIHWASIGGAEGRDHTLHAFLRTLVEQFGHEVATPSITAASSASLSQSTWDSSFINQNRMEHFIGTRTGSLVKGFGHDPMSSSIFSRTLAVTAYCVEQGWTVGWLVVELVYDQVIFLDDLLQPSENLHFIGKSLL